MPLTDTYLVTVKNLSSILTAIRGGQAPDRFTVRFLETLGFKSTNDRAIISVLKGLGFITDDGTPKQRYFDYLDDTRHKEVMGAAIQEAYADLFRINSKACNLPKSEIVAKLKTLTQGSKGKAVLDKMAMTFTALCKEATFTPPTKTPPAPRPTDQATPQSRDANDVDRKLQLSYVISLQLPTTKDQAVYEAIFKALKDHLL